MESLVNILKTPLHFTTNQLLGDCLFSDEGSYAFNLVKRVTEVALAGFSLLGAIISSPLWVIGDLIEARTIGSRHFHNDKVDLPNTSHAELSLDPETTRHVGFSISTYQNTSNPQFCANSNWGRYVEVLQRKPGFVPPGQGVDILTEEGRAQICNDVLAAGGNTLRFSVEMADVFPGNRYNEVAMQRYVAAARYIEQRGIKPIVTLSHFVHNVRENGKDMFEERQSIDEFVRFAQVAYEALHEHVDTFMTFNEPNVSCFGNYVLGDFASRQPGHIWKHNRALSHMLEAHVKTYDALNQLARNKQKSICVGLTHQALKFSADSRWNILARITCFVMTYFTHRTFMNWAEKHQNKIDLLGVQYYTRPLIGRFPPDSIARAGEKMVESMRFRFDPAGIYPILKELGTRLRGVQLMVTETGTAGPNNVGTSDEMDLRREEYTRESIKAVRRAQDEAVPINGYLAWSLYGNFEWPHGFSRDHDFGVIARDPATKRTRHTAGFDLLAQVFQRSIRGNHSTRAIA